MTRGVISISSSVFSTARSLKPNMKPMSGMFLKNGMPRSLSGDLVLDEAAEHQRLIVQQHHRGLGLALDEGRRAGRRHRWADRVHLLLDVERDRAALADARGHGEDHAGVAVLDGLVQASDGRRRRGVGDGPVGGACSLTGARLLAGDDRHRVRHVDDGLLVLGGHHVRVRDDVDAVLGGQGVEQGEELAGREHEGGEPAAGQGDEPADRSGASENEGGVDRPSAGVERLTARSGSSPPSAPSRRRAAVSSVSAISATSTSISTWRGMRSSCLIVASMSVHCRGVVVTMIALVVSSAMKRTWPSASGASAVAQRPAGRHRRRRREAAAAAGRRADRPGGRRWTSATRWSARRLAAAVDRVQRGAEVLGLGVLGVVDEHAPAAARC